MEEKLPCLLARNLLLAKLNIWTFRIGFSSSQ